MPVDDPHPHDDAPVKFCAVYERICMRTGCHFVFVFGIGGGWRGFWGLTGVVVMGWS